MCDIRLFQSARMDYDTAVLIWKAPYNDERFLNNAAYHLQQSVEKLLKAALECIGVTVPNTHRINRLVKMIGDHGANLMVTDWIDDHAEMLSEWEVQTRYNMDFLVEKRKIDAAIREVGLFLDANGIKDSLRDELTEASVRERLLSCLPESRRCCTDFELNCYYIMFRKKLSGSGAGSVSGTD